MRTEGAGTPTEQFDYPLPARAIAQQPLAERSSSRMLVLEPEGTSRDSRVTELPRLLRPGDCLVVNDTRVRAARLRGWVGERSGEILLLRELAAGRYLALARPARALPPGAAMAGEGWRVLVESVWPGHPAGREVFLQAEPGVELAEIGEVPLPPYLKQRLRDPGRYQTVYATGPAVSAAAPTAGLHLTETLLQEVEQAGVLVSRVQLEVGLATFTPIRTKTIEAHPMHAERYRIGALAAAQVQSTRSAGGRVVAVGTTAVRCLESSPDGSGGVLAGSGETELYLRPGSHFRVVDGLLTNFHQPRSSLLVLVSAFYGRDRVLAEYSGALQRGYRFLSFGDCMFGWRRA
ncbi:MAG TPA: tRNA preQ1(34) S-adenosylmethionine ribosyltransferase-isomerase QueA [Candidatus Dormibacteraeota bacterium]|nr:tRNA preQ1(34) S-adenosylmethionine ribosyltransferase-isomerase QueA [Candidatus Dormibacteraeota bacterium]